MSTIKLLGISGKRGAGKGTIAEVLQYQCGYHHADVYVVNFADALKTVCASLEYPGQPDEVLGHYYEQPGKAAPSGLFGLTRGELLQEVGEALRKWRPNVWVEVLTKYVYALLSALGDDQLIVVADIRYPNEAQAIKEAGGVLLRVEGDPLGQRGDGTRDDNHESEVALDHYDGFDVVLMNNGTPEQLQRRVLSVLDQLRRGEGGQYSTWARTGNSRWTPRRSPLPEVANWRSRETFLR